MDARLRVRGGTATVPLVERGGDARRKAIKDETRYLIPIPEREAGESDAAYFGRVKQINGANMNALADHFGLHEGLERGIRWKSLARILAMRLHPVFFRVQASKGGRKPRAADELDAAIIREVGQRVAVGERPMAAAAHAMTALKKTAFKDKLPATNQALWKRFKDRRKIVGG